MKQISDKVEILNKKIKIKYQNKEIYVNVDKDRRSISFFENGLNVMGNFELDIGKIKIGEKKIIELPTIKFIKCIKVYKYNPVADGLNIDTSKDIYYGPVEGYKGK